MAHHAYVVNGSSEKVLEKAKRYVLENLSTPTGTPDIVTFTFGLFSVEDARKITGPAYQSASGEGKVIIFYASRLFHEAQNALLKVFEEPPQGVTIILGVPSVGILLPTLRSRLLPLPEGNAGPSAPASSPAAEFLAQKGTDREKYIAKLIDRTKSDKDEVKQGARAEATELMQDLISHTHKARESVKTEQIKDELLVFLQDLTAFMPLMFERSTPLKLIFEHIQLVVPKSLAGGKV